MLKDNKIFLISGLGADKRTFDKLHLDFNKSIVHADWINPEKNESLTSYSKRLVDLYKIHSDDIVIGLSFGGAMAIEVSKHIHLSKTIIISSVRNKYDLPRLFTLSGNLGLTRLVPKKIFKTSNFFIEKGFGAFNNEDKLLLRNIIGETNTFFAKWAVHALATWNEINNNNQVIRIHGDNDKIIPLKNKTNYLIPGGSHLMVSQKADVISKILNEEIKLSKVNSE